MAAEKVQTRHPTPGKTNFPVDERSYELFEAAIVRALRDRRPTHAELVDLVASQVEGTFEGNVSWHTMTVKLDLEARGVIERTSSRPQRYRLV